jgi:hypothetical protein
MISGFQPTPDHPKPKTGNKRCQNLMAAGELEESLRAFGLPENFCFEFFGERWQAFSTGKIGFLLKIPEVISHLPEFFVEIAFR